ncbi:MAG TPA: response regulator [Gemmatimonadaceae bacterium]|nr:response regulator [Gemmatimonadaceae bacterium]
MSQRILVVEDSATQAMALSALLEEQGYEVDHAESAEGALARVGTCAYDVILTDVVMPGINGYELCRRLKELTQSLDTPVVLLTSLNHPLDIVRGLECGADNYVTKPYDPEHLLARVRNVVDRPKLRRNVRASMGVNVAFLGTTFSITADKEQILDLFISSVEDVVRTNQLLRDSQQQLASAQAQLESYATRMAYQARVSSEKYAGLMANAHDAILVLDDAGTIVEANVRALDLLGCDFASVQGRSLSDFAREDQRPALAGLSRLRSEDRTAVDALWFEHSSGRSTCCSLAASRSVVGDRGLVLVVLHDVTQRRRDQEELARSAERLRLALDAAQMATWEWDVPSDELHWSSSHSWPGFGPNPGIDERWTLEACLALVHPDDLERVRATMLAMTESAAPQEIEFRLEAGAHEIRWIYVKGRGVSAPDGGTRPSRVVGVMLDVTRQRGLEAQLQQSQKMEAVGQLAGGVAHDFNNMLTAILSYGQLAFDDLPEGATRNDVGEIVNAAQRAAALTRQLLAFSRQQVLRPQDLDLNATIANIESMLRRLIVESIQVETRLAPGLWTVRADPGQVEQVLMNLAVNARDAMGDSGTLVVETSNHVVASGISNADRDVPAGEYVVMAVSDTGCGIDPALRQRIFEPFFTTKPPGQGTGLGLATIYGIVKQSGGHIILHSEMGVGTTFRIFLPRADAAEGAAPEESPADEPSAGGLTKGSALILLAEDDADLRAVAIRVLRQAGYDVVETNDGEQALRSIERLGDAIQLIVSDVVMPQLTGPELARTLRERGVKAPLLLMSGYTSDSAIQNGVLLRGVSYLEKPFTPEMLTRRVREALDGAGRESRRSA